MNFNVTQKILVGYVVGFILLMAFAALTLLNGKKIEATTVALSQEKIPGLIAAASLKSNVQAQSNHLYELYATNDQAAFSKQHEPTITEMKQQVAKLQSLTEYKIYEAELAKMGAKQAALTNQFVQIMRQPEVDWDVAREALSAFSKSTNEMGASLDGLVKNVSDQTLASANASKNLTEQLINLALVLAGLTFLGVLAAAYYSHRQVAVPLREISDVLGGIAARKDLTYRIKQRSEDEIGKISAATNNLLEEFQKLARTLDGTAQEVNRTSKNLTEIAEAARLNMSDSSADALKNSTTKLQKLAENMHSQIRLLNF
jgi:methyl-accepting chemotaxis protein